MPTTAAKTVDVRGMQCAQALAQASQAMRQLDRGEVLELICNASDVRDDLMTWAKELSHELVSTHVRNKDTWLQIRRGPHRVHGVP